MDCNFVIKRGPVREKECKNTGCKWINESNSGKKCGALIYRGEFCMNHYMLNNTK